MISSRDYLWMKQFETRPVTSIPSLLRADIITWLQSMRYLKRGPGETKRKRVWRNCRCCSPCNGRSQKNRAWHVIGDLKNRQRSWFLFVQAKNWNWNPCSCNILRLCVNAPHLESVVSDHRWNLRNSNVRRVSLLLLKPEAYTN